MSPPLLLRAYVNERLTAAAEEIFQVFEKTIAKYEEEASSSKQEIERLRGLLLDFMSNQKTGVSQTSACKDETPSELEPSLSVRQDPEPEPRHIKQEDHELWADQQQEDDLQVGEFNDPNVLYPHRSSVWEENEQEDTKPSLQPHIQNSEHEEEFEEDKTVHFMSPLGSSTSPQTLILNENVQDGRESDRPAASFTADQTQTEQSQTFYSISAELSQLSSVVPDYPCYLCSKSFSSSHHLINHALRVHSKDEDVICAVCGKTLASAESLNVHLQSHKGSKCCHMCGKHCNSTTALTEHMASHAGVKLHRCHVCGKECSRKGDLKIHMRIHTGEKPFCCSFCCKSFTHSGHLRKHMRSHTGERPHRCDVCGRGFLQSAHLKYHLGTHAQKC